ncbi:MAG: acyl carrier protein [Thermodesulfobacteriota bacterium]
MSKVEETINKVIGDIQEQQGLRKVELENSLEIVADLGFKSLDIAQLIASLEVELGTDPFSTGVPLADVVNMGDLYNLYQAHA